MSLLDTKVKKDEKMFSVVKKFTPTVQDLLFGLWKLNDKTSLKLISCLAKAKKLITLNISCQTESDRYLPMIGEAIGNVSTLKQLIISITDDESYQLDPLYLREDRESLSEGQNSSEILIHGAKSLKIISMNCKVVNSELFRAICSGSKVQTLDLHWGEELSDKKKQSLLNELANIENPCPNLEVIKLAVPTTWLISQYGREPFIHYLTRHPNLKAIEFEFLYSFIALPELQLTENEQNAFIDIMTKFSFLQKLIMKFELDCINEALLKALMLGIEQCSSLKCLHVLFADQNVFNDPLLVIMNHIKNLKNLEELELRLTMNQFPIDMDFPLLPKLRILSLDMKGYLTTANANFSSPFGSFLSELKNLERLSLVFPQNLWIDNIIDVKKLLNSLCNMKNLRWFEGGCFSVEESLMKFVCGLKSCKKLKNVILFLDSTITEVVEDVQRKAKRILYHGEKRYPKVNVRAFYKLVIEEVD